MFLRFSVISFRARRLWHSANDAAERHAKSIKNDTQNHEKSSENNGPKPFKNQPQIDQKSIENQPHIDPKSIKNRPKIDQKSVRSSSEATGAQKSRKKMHKSRFWEPPGDIWGTQNSSKNASKKRSKNGALQKQHFFAIWALCRLSGFNFHRFWLPKWLPGP